MECHRFIDFSLVPDNPPGNESGTYAYHLTGRADNRACQSLSDILACTSTATRRKRFGALFTFHFNYLDIWRISPFVRRSRPKFVNPSRCRNYNQPQDRLVQERVLPCSLGGHSYVSSHSQPTNGILMGSIAWHLH